MQQKMPSKKTLAIEFQRKPEITPLEPKELPPIPEIPERQPDHSTPPKEPITEPPKEPPTILPEEAPDQV